MEEETFYNSFYNIFESLFGGAPGWVNEYVLPIFIILIFGFIIYFLLKLFTNLMYSFTNAPSIGKDADEKPKFKRKKGKFY